MDANLGTRWVAPGEGLSAKTLLDALAQDCLSSRFSTALYLEAMSVLGNILRKYGQAHGTNLQLTGSPLTDYDLRRIAVCE